MNGYAAQDLVIRQDRQAEVARQAARQAAIADRVALARSIIEQRMPDLMVGTYATPDVPVQPCSYAVQVVLDLLAEHGRGHVTCGMIRAECRRRRAAKTARLGFDPWAGERPPGRPAPQTGEAVVA